MELIVDIGGYWWILMNFHGDINGFRFVVALIAQEFSSY